jgi:hypothetical protein
MVDTPPHTRIIMGLVGPTFDHAFSPYKAVQRGKVVVMLVMLTQSPPPAMLAASQRLSSTLGDPSCLILERRASSNWLSMVLMQSSFFSPVHFLRVVLAIKVLI